MTMLPLHMGALHPVEQALVLGVAFGPFILLVVIAFVRARRGGRPDETSDRDGNSP